MTKRVSLVFCINGREGNTRKGEKRRKKGRKGGARETRELSPRLSPSRPSVLSCSIIFIPRLLLVLCLLLLHDKYIIQSVQEKASKSAAVNIMFKYLVYISMKPIVENTLVTHKAFLVQKLSAQFVRLKSKLAYYVPMSDHIYKSIVSYRSPFLAPD